MTRLISPDEFPGMPDSDLTRYGDTLRHHPGDSAMVEDAFLYLCRYLDTRRDERGNARYVLVYAAIDEDDTPSAMVNTGYELVRIIAARLESAHYAGEPAVPFTLHRMERDGTLTALQVSAGEAWHDHSRDYFGRSYIVTDTRGDVMLTFSTSIDGRA